MTETTNYKLIKPDGVDLYNVEDFNDNATVIDEVLKTLEESIEEKENELAAHIQDHDNPHQVTKGQIGLSAVENKSSAQIRSEITFDNVQSALYSPVGTNNTLDPDGASTFKYHILVLHDTAAHWDSVNPILKVGEFGYDTDNKFVKVGDGNTAWRDLPILNYNRIYTDLVAYVNQVITALINGAPDALDTLKELADAIEEHEDLLEALEAIIEGKADNVLASPINDGLMSSRQYTKVEALSSGIEKIVTDDTFDNAPDPSSYYLAEYTRTLGKGASYTVDQSQAGLGTEARQVSFHGTNIDIYFGSTKYINRGTGYTCNAFPTIEFCVTKQNILDALEAPSSGTSVLTNNGTWMATEDMVMDDFQGRTLEQRYEPSYDEYVYVPVAGVRGAVPAPPAIEELQFINNSGEWQDFDDAVDQFPNATRFKHGFMSLEDKKKLDGIEAEANKYVHPNGNGYNHVPAGGSSGNILAWNSTGRAKWVDPATIISIVDYSPATTTADGLMSKEDKAKLNGIEANANNYVHPTESGYYHIPSGGSSGQILSWFDNGQAQWIDMPEQPVQVEVNYTLSLTGTQLKLYNDDTVVSTVNLPTYTLTKSSDQIILSSGGVSSPVTLDTYSLSYNDGTLSLNKSDGTKSEVELPMDNLDGYAISMSNNVITLNNPYGDNSSVTLNTYALAYSNGTLTLQNSGGMNSTVSLDSYSLTYNNGTLTLVNSNGGTSVVDLPTFNVVSTTEDGLMTKEDKAKLDGIATGANNYVHPTYPAVEKGFYKITRDGNGHIGSYSAVTKADITALGIPSENTTYTDFEGATASAAGKAGLVPQPKRGEIDYFLKSDGTWADIQDIFLEQIIPIERGGTGVTTLADIKELLDIDNVDNTADVDKPISTATQAAINLKADQATTYTKDEVDTMISSLTTGLDWKESVDTYASLATVYPSPQDGWTVNVNDTDYTYRYDGTKWVAISANAIPLASSLFDGLMSKEDKVKLDALNDVDTAYSACVGGTNQITLTTLGGTSNVVSITPSIEHNVTYTELNKSQMFPSEPYIAFAYGSSNGSSVTLSGIVGPGPKINASSTNMFLRGDGTWADLSELINSTVDSVNGQTGDVVITASSLGLGDAVKSVTTNTTTDHLVVYGGDHTKIKDSQIALADIQELLEIGAGTVYGVRGEAESEYRTGEVEITKANIGLGNVTNHQQIAGLASGTTENHVVSFGSDGYTVKDSGISVADIQALITGGGGGAVSGVKGSAESSYRTGDVNITPANLGLEKAVKFAGSNSTNYGIAYFSSTTGSLINSSTYTLDDIIGIPVTGTVAAGATSVTLSNSAIQNNKHFQIYTGIYGYSPNSITVGAGSMTLGFAEAPPNSSSCPVEVRVFNY